MEDTTDLRGNKNRPHFPEPEDPPCLSQGPLPGPHISLVLKVGRETAGVMGDHLKGSFLGKSF